jgi:hypothetical protein
MIPKIICSIAAEKSINNLAVPFGSLRYQKRLASSGGCIVIFFNFFG